MNAGDKGLGWRYPDGDYIDRTVCFTSEIFVIEETALQATRALRGRISRGFTRITRI